jgi:hypothetical protein
MHNVTLFLGRMSSKFPFPSAQLKKKDNADCGNFQDIMMQSVMGKLVCSAISRISTSES